MRNIRPSYVSIDVDGRATRMSTGPRARHGRMVARFMVRAHGTSRLLLSVECIAARDGKTVRVVVSDLRSHGILFDETLEQ